MELIENLKTTKDVKGHYISWGMFLCPFCLKVVRRRLSDGKKHISCGCVREELISKAKKSKKRKPFSEKHKQNMSEAHLGMSYSDETNRKKGRKGKNHPFYDVHRFGELAPNWQNGISNNPYPIEFDKPLKQFIFERDNYTCQSSNCEHKTNLLDAHHIDYNKQNNNLDNFITLCHSCHAKTNGKKKRQYYTEFYQNIMINRIMECLL